MSTQAISEPKEMEAYLEERRSLTAIIKSRIIEVLQLPLEEDRIDLDCPLFGSGLGLDSVDAVGLAAMIETDFNVRVFDSDISMFRSINSIVDFILSRKAEAAAGKEPDAALGHIAAQDLEIEGRFNGSKNAAAARRDYVTMRNHIGLVEFFSPALIKIEGAESEDFIDFIIAGDVTDLPVGCLLHSLVLNQDGTILSIVWLAKHDTNYWLIADRQKHGALLDCLNHRHGTRQVEIVDQSKEYDLLALIGPRAQELMVDFFDEDLLRLGYGDFEISRWNETEIFIGRYGETGEFDYRLIVPAGTASTLTTELEDAGSIYQLRKCRQDSLKTLMMEMKSIHQDSMLITGCTPRQLDLQWMVDFQKGDFLGREKLLENLNKNYYHGTLLTADHGSEVQEGDQVWLEELQIGSVQAWTYSPVLSQWVIFAMVDSRYALPNLRFQVKGRDKPDISAISRSAPLFLTRTIIESLNI